MPEDKKRKAQGEEIDISNKMLFLRIEILEREVAYLMREVDKLKWHTGKERKDA